MTHKEFLSAGPTFLGRRVQPIDPDPPPRPDGEYWDNFNAAVAASHRPSPEMVGLLIAKGVPPRRFCSWPVEHCEMCSRFKCYPRWRD